MTQTQFQELPLSALTPSRRNPRSIRTKGALARIDELARSVKAQGILQPLVVRRNGKGFVILAGERRFKAAQRAGLEVVPCIVREASDEDAAAITVTENLQRVQLHPLQEAEGIARLVDEGESAADVAAVLGVSEALVSRRLQLRHLAPALKALYLGDESPLEGWSVRMLELAASYPKAEQERLVEQCNQRFGEGVPRSVRELRRAFERYGLALASAPWQEDDATLNGPPCTGCSENTGTHASLFADLDDEPARCLDRECFGLKRRAWLLHSFLAAKVEHGDALQVVSLSAHSVDGLPPFGQEVRRCFVSALGHEKDDSAAPAFVAVQDIEIEHPVGSIVWVLPEISKPETRVGEGSAAPAEGSIEAKLARSEELLRRKRYRHAVAALVAAAEHATVPSAAKLLRLAGLFGGPQRQASRSAYRRNDHAQALSPQAQTAWEAFESPEDDAALRESVWRSVQRVLVSRLDVTATFDDFDRLEAECAAYARLCVVPWSDLWEAARQACPPSKALTKRREVCAA